MSVHFYRYDLQEPAGPGPSFPPNVELCCWRPDSDGYPPAGRRSISNHFWWALGKVGGFGQAGFTELRVEREGRLLHRLIVTPVWYRFPFMTKDDLQIGDVWTSPEARRQQLARAAIIEAHHRFGRAGGRFWYVTDATNVASGALARSCGYRLVATGRRTRRFGLRLLGQFVITRWVQRAETDTQATAPDCAEESGAGRTLRVNH
jgi:RimJ/RimL family protein N-acetyltransferase